QKQQAQKLYSQYLESLNKPNTNPILQGNKEEQVKKFAELQERLNNKEFLKGAKNAYESSKGLQEWGTQEQYNDYIARVSLGIFKNPSSGKYNYESRVKDIVYHGSYNKNIQKFDKSKFLSGEGAMAFGKGFYFTLNEATAFFYHDFLEQAKYNFESLDAGEQLLAKELAKSRIKGEEDELEGKVYKVLLNIQNPTYWEHTSKDQKSKLIQGDYGNYDSVIHEAEGFTRLVGDQDKFQELQFELSRNENTLEKGHFGAPDDVVTPEIRIELLNRNKEIEIELDKYSKFIQGETHYIIPEPEQIHILASKQDIQGFKEFVDKTQETALDTINENFTIKIDQFTYTYNPNTYEVIHNSKNGNRIEVNETQINKVLLKYAIANNYPTKAFNNQEYVKINNKVLNINNSNEVKQKQIVDLFQETIEIDNINTTSASTSGITYNQEQLNAIDNTLDYLQSTSKDIPFYVIEGKAGTGKTTIVKEILKQLNLKSKKISVAALSNKAKNVLAEKITEDKELTDILKQTNNRVDYYSLAGLLGYKENIETGVWEKTEESLTEDSPIDNSDIVIVDEASMVNEEQLALITEFADTKKILFLGDIGQLPPIRSENSPYYINYKKEDLDKPSPVFNTKDKSKLLIRVRQGEESPILPYADNYWNNSQLETALQDPIKDRNSELTQEGNLVFTNKATVTKIAINEFKRGVKENNSNLIRLIVYKNDTREAINTYFHNTIFGKDSLEFNPGEPLMMYKSYKSKNIIAYSNSDEINVKDLQPKTFNVHGEKFEGFNIVTEAYDYGGNLIDDEIPVISKKDLVRYNKLVSDAFNVARSADKYKKGALFAEAWNLRNKFASLDYAYAITAHKSQGSTYESVIVFEDDIMNVKSISNKTKSRAVYTAITRARNNTIIVSEKNSNPLTDFELNRRVFELNKEDLDLNTAINPENEADRIIGQANIKALTVLIDVVNQKQDTLPHEYAHHYIAWFRDTPIVQEAIKKWGSEEALVQSIGEQAVKQKGEALNWWNNFVKWIMDGFNSLSKLEKQELTQILTDAFLTRQDLRNQNIPIYKQDKTTKINELQTRKKELQDFLNLTKSPTGLSANRDPNGIKYFTDDPDLHGPIWKDGKLQHAKVFLPHTVLKSIPGADKMSGAELKEILGDSLTEIIGYRIPNQGLSSIDALEIIGILPASYGDMIMTYTEITKKTGSDFDVDKMFVMMPNLKYNKYTNKVEKVKYIEGTDKESTKERYYQTFKSKILKDKYEEINSVLEELNTETTEKIEEAKAVRNEAYRMYGKESEQYNNAVDDLSELYTEYEDFKSITLDYIEQDETIPSLEEFSQLPIHKQNSKKALQNHLLTLYTNILSSENTFEEYITPLDDDSIKYDCNIVAYIEAVSPGKEFLEKSEEEKYKIASDYFKGEGDLRFYTEEHQIETKVRNVAGKAGTGQTSNHLTSHPLFQIAEVAIKQDLGLGEVTKLDRKTTLDNERLINQILSLELNAFVDNAKDPFISLVNFNTYTSNAAFYLLRAGVDFRIVNRLLSQPIIKDLVANNNLLNSKVIETGYATMPDVKVSLDKIDIIKRKGKKTATVLTLAKYKIGNNIELTLDEISRADLKLSDLTEDKLNILLNAPKTDRTSDAYKRNQLKLLALFLKVRKGGSLLNDVIKATKADTKGAGTSFAESIAIKDLQNKLKEEGLVVNFDKLFEKTTLGAYNKNSLELADTVYRSKLITSTPGFKSILATVYNAVGKDSNYLIDAEFNSFVAKAYYRYISSGIPMFRISMEEKEKLFTELGKKVTDLQSKTDNLFIKELDIKSVPNSYTFIGMESGKISNTEINNMLTSSWLEALESDNNDVREMAIDLIKYAYFSSGFKKTINSFYELMPMAYMNNVRNDNFKVQYENVLQDLQFPVTDYIFVDQLIRHNPTDSNLTTSIKDLPFRIVKGTNNIMFESSDIPEKIRAYRDLDSHTETNYVMYVKRFSEGKPLLYRFNHVDAYGNVYYKRVGLLGLEGAETSRKQDKVVEYNYQGKATSFIDKYKEVDFETESVYKHLPKRNFSFLEQVIDETSFKYKGLQVNGKDVVFKMEETVDGIKVIAENSVGNKIEVGLPIEEHGGYSTFTRTRFATTAYLNQNGVESIMNALNLPC
ncbi:MAG: DEAD/DEAH box helicase, partial [Clostridia bacterium]